MRPLRFLQIGNLEPPHSTENELRKAIEFAGHSVTSLQEHERGTFDRAARMLADFDLVFWTRTLHPRMDTVAMRRMLDAARSAGVPTVGYHLDLWHGLPRASEIGSHPFFEVDLLCTADGGHDDEWAKLGIDHAWFPPGVSEAECEPGTPRPNYASDVAFVGSWAGYHPEHVHRYELVSHLQRQWAGRVELWPKRGEHAVRGPALRDLYASVKVVVGDSCLCASGITRYCSDRLPETLGRGGFLLHPHVSGVTDGTLYTDGVHLRCWEAGDWAELDRLIGYYLAESDERAHIAEQGRAHVLAHHTYTRRIGELVEVLRDRHLIPKAAA